MKIGDRQESWYRMAILAMLLLGRLLLVYVTGCLILDYAPSFGMAPCEARDGFTLTAHGLEASLIVIGISLPVSVSRYRSDALLIAAITIPVAAWLLQDITDKRDAFRQRQCIARPLAEAMKACGANPAHYRIAKDQYGYDTATLVAQGTTYREWNCLFDWSRYNHTISMKVDENVDLVYPP